MFHINLNSNINVFAETSLDLANIALCHLVAYLSKLTLINRNSIFFAFKPELVHVRCQAYFLSYPVLCRQEFVINDNITSSRFPSLVIWLYDKISTYICSSTKQSSWNFVFIVAAATLSIYQVILPRKDSLCFCRIFPPEHSVPLQANNQLISVHYCLTHDHIFPRKHFYQTNKPFSQNPHTHTHIYTYKTHITQTHFSFIAKIGKTIVTVFCFCQFSKS